MSAAQLACLMLAAPFLLLATIFGTGLLSLPLVERLVARRRARAYHGNRPLPTRLMRP
jgi:hypothetical protein